MWRAVSLRMRFNALFGSLLAFGLVIDIAAMILGAGPRVEAEVKSSMRLATEFIGTALAGFHGADQPDQSIAGLVSGLRNIRHVRVSLAGPSGAPLVATRADQRGTDGVPRWFARLVDAKPIVTRIPADVDGQNYGQIVIASYPWDEMAEVWDDVQSLALVGAALIVAVFAFTFFIVDRWLSPIGRLSEGLARLELGDHSVRIAPVGPPELVGIGVKLNSLAEALGRAKAENRLLLQKLISFQDEERRELARELHDEFGSHLFAIRANTTSLLMAADDADRPAPRVAATSQAIIGLVDALQQLNRRILGRLRPAALGELGLGEALRSLASTWTRSRPAVDVSLTLPGGLDDLDEIVGLTIYRVVQESLTNVFRHAEATKVDVVVEYRPSEASARNGEAGASVRVLVADNGVGMSPSARRGLGLAGMDERIRGLGGSLTISSAAAGGVTVEALLPAAGASEPGTAEASLEGSWAKAPAGA